MITLKDNIAAYDAMQEDLEARHHGAWVVFYDASFVDAYPDFEAAASAAVDAFDEGPYLIRQVGTAKIQLSGGMIFTPAHVLGEGRV